MRSYIILLFLLVSTLSYAQTYNIMGCTVNQVSEIDYILEKEQTDGSFIPIDTILGTDCYSFPVTDPGNNVYRVTPQKDINVLNGVTTFDEVIIVRHILGHEFLPTPYAIIAADVNGSQTVSILDAIQLRRVILKIDAEFPGVPSWEIVPEGYDPNGTGSLDESYIVEDITADVELNFIAIKIGDVNNTYDPAN